MQGFFCHINYKIPAQLDSQLSMMEPAVSRRDYYVVNWLLTPAVQCNDSLKVESVCRLAFFTTINPLELPRPEYRNNQPDPKQAGHPQAQNAEQG